MLRPRALTLFTLLSLALPLAALAAEEAAPLNPRLMNVRMSQALRSRAVGLSGSASTVDTTYVGYTPGHSGDNYWSIWSGSDKFSVPSGPYHRPPARGAMWDFEPPYGDVHGDTLQGWWSVRNIMSGTGGLTIPDYNRPWRALDYGNDVNYAFGRHPDGSDKRTFGVVGMWHVDGGNTVAVPATVGADLKGGVTWAPLSGSASAWMGMRRHGDTSHIDDVARGGTGNAYNEDTSQFQQSGSVSSGGTDKLFPGYAAQMDQMLYRDIDLSGAGDTSLTIAFLYRTTMSAGFSTNNASRTGWFVHDPLAVITGGSNPNFIASSGNATPPVDSLMVYVGAPAEGAVVLSDGVTHSIYDAKRRWFGEVIRSNEGLYKQIHSAGGNIAATTRTATISGAGLAALKAAGADTVRLVFRVKTNHIFDDGTMRASAYSSGGAGAAIVDQVSIQKGIGPAVVIGAFESASEIDNSTGVSAAVAWKSTGKPTQPFHHAHFLSNGGPSATLIYQDLCGQVGSPNRICDMRGVVVSAGDHDHDERSGGTFGTAEQEPFQGIVSPTINLVAGAAPNNMGLTASTAEATEDYYVDYEIYTGIFDFFTQGNAWRFGFQSYPAATTPSGVGEHPRWGDMRFPPFIYFNPDKQCFRNLDAAKANGMLRTTAPDGIPDSVRIMVSTRQECYRFGLPQSEHLGGAYWDNLSLAIIDGAGGDPLSLDPWFLYHDTFPANDNASLVGVPASFDTTTALIKNGLNIAPSTANTSRFDVAGDTTVVTAEGDSVRVDMVFRILPGPGNYVNAALGVNSPLRAVTTSTAPIPAPASGITNFWSNYMFANGAHGTPAGHPTAVAGPLAGQRIWSPNVWNSARMDTAQINVFPVQNRGVLQIPGTGAFMSAYHETELADLHRGALGIARNICFIADTLQTVSTQTIICGSGNVPAGVVYPPVWTSAPGSGYNGQSTTAEGTKIIPDGLLTPGAHVQYFFRRQDGGSPNLFLGPDTTVVSPQVSEGSTDGHRWQQFGVLPDRWKSPNYTHPVLGTPGRGAACMLYIDQNDRRGNERTWVGVADTIGATRGEKFGAHNGWQAPRGVDINDPAYFVRRHIGQPGTTWDMYGVKAAESLNAGSGSIGSRGGTSGLSFNNPANTQINGKTSRQGPSEAMFNTYYKILLILTGDLNSSIFGPFTNKSQNDYKIMQDFLLSGNPTSPDRGLLAEGSGLVESLDQTSEGFTFMTAYLGVELRNDSYINESGNTSVTGDIFSTTAIEGPGPTEIYGIRNACTASLDVFARTPGLAAETVESTFYEPVGAGAPYASGVLKNHTAAHPWIALTDGWDIELLTSRDDRSSVGRILYFYNVFNNVFSAICDIDGALPPSDTPRDDGRLVNFMNLLNNPLRSGSTTINFGTATAERVKIQVFDVSGRLIRTLADRRFAAGEYRLTWDGIDNANRAAARGVYFVRTQHADTQFSGQSKLVILK